MKQEPLEPTSDNETRTVYTCGSVFYIEAQAGHVLADHVHEQAETLWILEGRGKIQVGDQTYAFKAPCTLKIPGDTYHKLKTETGVRLIEQKHKTQ